MSNLLIAILIFTAIGIMVRVISIKKGLNLVFWVVALIIAGPVIYGMIKFRVLSFLSESYPWWVYPLTVLAILVALRLIMDWLFARDQRR